MSTGRFRHRSLPPKKGTMSEFGCVSILRTCVHASAFRYGRRPRRMSGVSSKSFWQHLSMGVFQMSVKPYYTRLAIVDRLLFPDFSMPPYHHTICITGMTLRSGGSSIIVSEMAAGSSIGPAVLHAITFIPQIARTCYHPWQCARYLTEQPEQERRGCGAVASVRLPS